MHDPFRWSISLGRWGVATVRLHVFFLVFAAATYFLCGQDASLATTATLAMGVLLLSVLAHEWSHWLVAHRYAVAPDTLIIGPLGGVSEWPETVASPSGLASMLAGPAANLVVCGVCAVVLMATGLHTELTSLFNPLQPAWTETGTPLALQVLQLTLWINWMLFLASLLPAFPFDGGRILRAALSLARPTWDPRRVADIVFWIAVVLSALMMGAALVLLKGYGDSAVFSTAFASLLLLAVVLLVSARRDVDNSGYAADGIVYDTELEDPWSPGSKVDEFEEEEDEDDFAEEDLGKAPEDDEYSADVASQDEPWLPTSVLDDRGPAPEEIEAEEERLVDAILSRLHTQGLESLSPEERELLERVSARYRSRLGRRS